MILNTSDKMALLLLIWSLHVAFRWEKQHTVRFLFTASLMPGCKVIRKSKIEAYSRKHGKVHSKGRKAEGSLNERPSWKKHISCQNI